MKNINKHKEKHKNNHRNMSNTNNNYDAEWEKKVEDYYTNHPHFKYKKWMSEVNERDHERELKEGFSKPEDWCYTEKYGWFRKGLIKATDELVKEGLFEKWSNFTFE